MRGLFSVELLVIIGRYNTGTKEKQKNLKTELNMILEGINMTLKSARINGMAIYSHVKHEEGAILYNAAKYAKKGIVEIGSLFGKSAIYLAQGSRDGNNVPVYCIDMWYAKEGNKTKDIYADFLRNTKPYEDTIRPIRGLSQVVADSFDAEFDVLFIDGDHSYKQVLLDWDLWATRIEEGKVLFHDIKYWEGPRKVFDTMESLGHLSEEHENLGKVTIGDGKFAKWS